MVKRTVFFLFPLLLLAFTPFANSVSVETAEVVVKNIIAERYVVNITGNQLNIHHLYTYRGDDGNYIYVFNINSPCEGFALIAADDVIYPVVAYSFEGNFDLENIPGNLQGLLDNYLGQIEYALDKKLNAGNETQKAWHKYTASSISIRRGYRAVSPLLSTNWDQGKYYNTSCPTDNSGPNGHVYAGCVATSMAQVMKYHNYPTQGSGSKSYYHSTYGTLSANFGLTTYNWAGMPNSVSSYNTSVATLLFHCGVSVEMQYGPNGSGAYVTDAASALKNYFGYKSTTQYKSKSSYSSSSWNSLIKGELDNSRPMVYRGQGSSGGHAWVVDGYQGSGNDHFHCNWGWSGHNNGYFYLSNLNPGSYTFTSYQGAVVGIEPNSTSQNYSLKLYGSISVSPNPLVKNGSISVWLDLANYGTGQFIGSYLVALYDNSGNYVTDIEEKAVDTLGAGYHYTNGLTFSKTTLSVSTGTYQIAAFYKPVGGSYQLLDEGNYTNPVSCTVTGTSQPDGMALYDAIATYPDSFIDGQAVTVVALLANYSYSSNFSGEVSAVLHKTTGEVLEIIETKTNVTLNSRYYDSLVFQSSGLTAGPGEYLISIQHKASGGSWAITDEDIYNNPISIMIVSPPLSPDIYEDNNVEADAHSFVATFTNNQAQIKTTGSNLHNYSDVDYYKVSLPAGAKYTISSRVHDSHNSGDGNTYYGDVSFSYKTSFWSTEFGDVEAPDVILDDGGVIYFKVVPYYDAIGTYLLEVNIVKEELLPDLYIYNENATPSIVDRGSSTQLNCTVKNQGTVNAASNSLKYYLSPDAFKSADDVELGNSNVPELGSNLTVDLNKTVVIPQSTPAGKWYILFVADAGKAVPEKEENNNLASQMIQVTISAGIAEQGKTSINLYPNPANSDLQISFSTLPYKLQLMDVSGKVLFSSDNIFTETFSLPLNNYSQGNYMIRILSDGEVYKSRFNIVR